MFRARLPYTKATPRNMYTQDEKEFQTGICRDTLVDWGNFFRDVTIEWYTKNEIVIG